jgi:ABC-2 type transport system permease protein
MSAWRTVLLVMGRDLAARRRATAIGALITVTLAVGGIVVAGLATGGSNRVLTGEEADRVLASLAVIILFMGLVLTGQIIAEGVAEEKRSRVVEVVLGTVAPRHLLMGKASAIGLMGLLEVVLLCASVAAAGVALDAFSLPRATPGALVAVVGWFLIGFAFYAAVYGAAGALVAPHENSANATLPVTMVLMVAYIAGLTAQNGRSLLIQVLSLLPPTAPLTMPLRIVLGNAAVWETVLSPVLTLAAAYGMVRLGARLYAGALMRGGRVRWRDAWRNAAHFG